MFCLLAYIVCDKYMNNEKGTDFFLWCLNVMTLLIGIIFLYCGIQIKQIIKSSLQELNENYVEIFNGTRMVQISMLIYTTLFSSIYEMIYFIMKQFVIYDYFDGKYKPNNVTGFWMHYVFLLSNLLTTFINYIAFYWLVRRQFYDRKKEIIEEGKFNQEQKGITLSFEEELMSQKHECELETNKFLSSDIDDNCKKRNCNNDNNNSFDDSF